MTPWHQHKNDLGGSQGVRLEKAVCIFKFKSAFNYQLFKRDSQDLVNWAIGHWIVLSAQPWNSLAELKCPLQRWLIMTLAFPGPSMKAANSSRWQGWKRQAWKREEKGGGDDDGNKQHKGLEANQVHWGQTHSPPCTSCVTFSNWSFSMGVPASFFAKEGNQHLPHKFVQNNQNRKFLVHRKCQICVHCFLSLFLSPQNKNKATTKKRKKKKKEGTLHSFGDFDSHAISSTLTIVLCIWKVGASHLRHIAPGPQVA